MVIKLSGEGNRPLGIFMDKDSEFLSFPTIYCDKRQANNSERLVPVHYSTICKWEFEVKIEELLNLYQIFFTN